MTSAPKERRHKGKPLAKMKQSTVDTVLLSEAMELRDDITLLRMRANRVIELCMAALDTKGEAE
jgi:hypothetical protein